MVLIKLFNNSGISETFSVPSDAPLDYIKKCAAEKYDSRQQSSAIDFNLYYLGKELRGREELSDYKLSEKSIIFAAPKPRTNFQHSEAPTAAEIDNLLGSLQATFSDAAHRHMLIKIVSSSETLKNLMDCVPGLRKDAKAQAVLNDPYLLIHWFNVENAAENFTAHPSLFAACQQLVEHMHAELVRHRGIPPALLESGMEGMEGYSSAEEEEGDEDMAGPAPQPNAGQSNQTPRMQITSEYLAAALAAAAATNSRTTGAAASTSRTNAPSSAFPATNNVAPAAVAPAAAAPPNILTTEMLRQAMQQALAAAAASNAATPTAAVPLARNFETQISELESMGFTDKEENLRALRHSNGDVQGALEFIINERERVESSMGLD